MTPQILYCFIRIAKEFSLETHSPRTGGRHGDLITATWLPRGVNPEAQFAARPKESVVAVAVQRGASAALTDLFHLPPEGVQLGQSFF